MVFDWIDIGCKAKT